MVQKNESELTWIPLKTNVSEKHNYAFFKCVCKYIFFIFSQKRPCSMMQAQNWICMRKNKKVLEAESLYKCDFSDKS